MAQAYYNGKIAYYQSKVAYHKVVRILDYDGNLYTSVTIGTQVWLVENLKTTHFNNGDAIVYPTNATEWAAAAGSETPAYGWPNHDILNKTPYGASYNWWVTQDSRGVCPEGYHIPDSSEISTLLSYLGGSSVAGGKLKETGTTHWNSPNPGDNSSGFTGVGAGWIVDWGIGLFKDYALFWTTTDADLYNGGRLILDSTSVAAYTSPGSKTVGQTIRCLMD